MAGGLFYWDKKEASQLINEKNLDATSKNGSVNASKSSILEIGENVKTLFSIPSETDTAYLDAVKRGDTETASKMVEEAAKRRWDIPKSFITRL